MARSQNNRGSSNQSGRNNNNPEGRNQYSGGVMDIARERPMTAALGAAAAVGAGVFLWSRRNQISEQLSGLSEQIGEWTENRKLSGSGGSSLDDTGGFASDSMSSQRGMSETGGGNASLGASSGGGGSTSSSASGRGRVRQSPTG